MSETYDHEFFEKEGSHNFESSEIIVPMIIDLIHPKTMIDVGCGVGPFAKSFATRGVDAYGIDGDYVDKTMLLIDENKFYTHNLEQRFNLNIKLDLAICLEVAEHLSPARAETFVEDLTNISDVILFSAAIVGQSGTHHVNCQFPSYWKKIFNKYNFVAVDYLRPRIWNDRKINVIYRQNTLFYIRESVLSRFPKLFDCYMNAEHQISHIIDLVHPDLYLLYLNSFIYRTEQMNAEIQRLKNK